MSFRHGKTVVLIAAVAALLSCSGGGSTLEPTGTIVGIVHDSTAGGIGLAGVQVEVVGTSFSAVTGAGGEFEVHAPVGIVTLRSQKAGYTFTDVVVEVSSGADSQTTVDIVAYAPLGAGQYRFVLTWGALPEDIDSHLILPGGDEVYFGDDTASDSSAYLDWDDTDSYGPETITIATVNSGTYTYYVYNYDESPDMGPLSHAVVEVFDRDGLIKTLKIDDAPGASSSTYLYWKVFTFNGSSFTWVNQMVSSMP